MSAASAISSARLNIEDLRQLVKKDLEASNELQRRIDRTRNDIAAGEKLNSTEVSLLGVEHKAIGRDLVHRIEQIEQQQNLTADDRNMLQALTARLGIHDLQSARIAELGDLLAPSEWLKVEEHPKGATSADKERTGSQAMEGTMPRESSPPAPLLEPATGSSQSSELTAGSSPMSLQPTGSYDVIDEDDLADEYIIVEEDDEDAGVDKSSWPLLYRILDIDPDTPDDDFNDRLER